MRTIEVPGDVYDALKVPESERDAVLKRELAVSLYREGILSFGAARELAELSHREFHRLLGDRRVERHYTAEELDEDLEYADG
jgi:predicted HTH domain antitoxin